MPKKPMSLETRNKISEGVKSTHQRKLDDRFAATSKSRQSMNRLGTAFSEGHPDGLEVSAIRNYGGFGVERRVEGLEERKKATLPSHEEKNSNSQFSENTQSDK